MDYGLCYWMISSGKMCSGLMKGVFWEIVWDGMMGSVEMCSENYNV